MPVPRCPECGRVLLINGKCENGCLDQENDEARVSGS